MTFVMGFNGVNEVIMFGDTRVSYDPPICPPRDALKKLCVISDSDPPSVLGFCADDIRAAKLVMTHLGKNKFPNYKHPFVMAHLKNDLKRWIREITTQLTPNQRKGLKFLLCGIEPKQLKKITKNKKITGFLPFPETHHIYRYTVRRKSGEVDVARRGFFSVIGSGKELESEIRKKSRQLIGFGFRSRETQGMRSAIMAMTFAGMFTEIKSAKVGGPFQVMRLTTDGIYQDYYLSPQDEMKGKKIYREEEKTIIEIPAENTKYTIYPICTFPFL